MFSSVNKQRNPVPCAISCSLDLIRHSGFHPQYLSEAGLHCTKQAFKLCNGLLPQKSPPSDSWHALKGGILTSTRKTHYEHTKKTQDCENDTKKKQRIIGKTIFNVPEQLIYITTRATLTFEGTLGEQRREATDVQLQKTSKHMSVIHRFQGACQQKQQYQKARNSFLQDRQRGTLIGSAAVSLLLTQPRWTMCTVWTENFFWANSLHHWLNMKDFKKENERQKREENRVLETNSFPVSLWSGHPVLSYDNVHYLLKWLMIG